MISVREGMGFRVMGDYMAYWHEVYTFVAVRSSLSRAKNRWGTRTSRPIVDMKWTCRVWETKRILTSCGLDVAKRGKAKQ